MATEAAEGIKESGRGAPVLGWDLRGVRLPFIWLFQNMATMKDTGKVTVFCNCGLCSYKLHKQVDHISQADIKIIEVNILYYFLLLHKNIRCIPLTSMQTHFLI